MTHIPTRQERRRKMNRVSKPEIPWQLCVCGKHGFKTQQVAFDAALTTSKHKGKPFRVYRCEVSDKNLWHMTSKVPESLVAQITRVDQTIEYGTRSTYGIRKVHQANIGA